MKWHFRQILDRWLNRGMLVKIAMVIALSCIIFLLTASLIILLFEKHIPYCSGLGKDDVIWQLYYYFADPGCQASANELAADGVESGAPVGNIGRWIGLVVSMLGSIFLSGLLISTITNGFDRLSDNWRTGFSYYRLKEHIVIIGSDQMVYGLVNQLCESTTKSIVVMTSTDVEQMRNSLLASLREKDHESRIVVNYGLRDSEEFLKKINVAYASEVYLLGDTTEFDDIESYHDSLNVHCLSLIAKQCQEAGNTARLKCHVLFEYKTTYHIFQYADLGGDISKYIDFHPFNFYDFWARKVLVVGYSKEENISYKPLDYIPISSADSDRYVHLIVIGMSQMGQAMALQAAHIAHFPNYKRRKTKITLIDANGLVEMNEFKQKCGELFKVSHSTFIDADAWHEAELGSKADGKVVDESLFKTEYHIAEEYRHLVADATSDDERDFIDVEWEFIKGHDHNPVVQRLLSRYLADRNAIPTVAVCLNITHISLRSAMSLPKDYYAQNVPILVQQRKTSTMVSMLNGNGFDEERRKKLLYKSVQPFGMVTDCYDLNMVLTFEVCKRISYVYDHFFAYDNLAVSVDKAKADKIWDETVMSKRWSNIFAATSIPTKLRCIGIEWDTTNPRNIDDLTDQQVAMLGEIEHNRWNIEELLLGYRPVYKDEDEKIDADKGLKRDYRDKFVHYDIRPFDKLKSDKSGRKANEYDEVIVRSLPLILRNDNENN